MINLPTSKKFIITGIVEKKHSKINVVHCDQFKLQISFNMTCSHRKLKDRIEEVRSGKLDHQLPALWDEIKM